MLSGKIQYFVRAADVERRDLWNYTDVCVKVPAPNYLDEFEDSKMFLLGFETLVEAYIFVPIYLGERVSKLRVHIALIPSI